jgi:hypothetical protein
LYDDYRNTTVDIAGAIKIERPAALKLISADYVVGPSGVAVRTVVEGKKHRGGADAEKEEVG